MSTIGEEDFREGMPFLGSRLWIDFVNSAPVALGDLIATPEGWRRWRAAAGLEMPAGGSGGGDDLGAVHELRAALARLFTVLATGAAPEADDVALVNRYLARAAVHPHLDLHGGALSVAPHAPREADALAAIALDFADFVTRHEPARLKHCSNPECSLVFYDTARNGARRWCSMATCGNRAKVRAHRLRATAVREA